MQLKSIGKRFTSIGSMLLVLGSALALSAQPPASGVENQRQAMQKLAFLAGKWSGPITVSDRQGEPLHLTQTEEIQFKLGGLVLLIEGSARDTAGQIHFGALATVAYDETTHQYRFRAYHDGHYLDAELSVIPNGFSWGFDAGPAKIVNTMHLTAKGEWAETTEAIVGSNPPHRSVEMLLQHQQ